jgi:tRNA-2-methylthio-N6-dimethylallyladenosine synthase
MFVYSARPGTPAALGLIDDVPEKEKKQRLQQLIELQESISARINQTLIGKTFDVLVEAQSRRFPNQVTGRTSGDKVVAFQGSTNLIGQIIPVLITKTSSHSLVGEICHTQASSSQSLHNY